MLAALAPGRCLRFHDGTIWRGGLPVLARGVAGMAALLAELAPLDAGAGGGLDGPARALAVYNGALIVGGDFTHAEGQVANHIAAFQGDAWSALGPGLDGRVLA